MDIEDSTLSKEEWFKLQRDLTERDLSGYPRAYRYQEFAIVTPSFFPKKVWRAYGVERKEYREKERCIVNYLSFQSRYLQWIRRLEKGIKRVRYTGDILFRQGGWPNLAEGDLPLIFKPYAFKIAMMREAKRLGYRFVLWVDSSMIPIASFEPLFTHLEEKQFVFHTSPRTFSYFCTSEFVKALGVTKEEEESVKLCRTGVFGVDLAHPLAREFLDLWYQYTLIEGASQTEAPEAMIVSLILHRLGAWEGRVFQDLFLEGEAVNQGKAVFFSQKGVSVFSLIFMNRA